MDIDKITYQQAEQMSEAALHRWLSWALKGDPSEARIKECSMSSKNEILVALVWVGAISSW